MPGRRRNRVPFAAALPACALAVVVVVLAIGGAGAASSSTVVTMDVPSATTLVNGCVGTAATSLGAIQPATGARTATGAGVCRVTFGSSNDTSQLRIGQSDGAGTAMRLGLEPPVLQQREGAPGRTHGVFGHTSGLALAVGRNSTMYRTTNSGATWLPLVPAPSGNHEDVEMLPGSTETWFAVGSGGTIYRTDDGLSGAPPTWSDESAALAGAGWSGTIYEISIPSAGTMVIGGASRRLAVQDIGLGTWTVVRHDNLSVGNIVAVDALDDDSFLAVGDNVNTRILMTDTGGTTSADWSVTNAPGAATGLRDAAYATSTRAYVVGDGGYVAVWDGATWTDRSSNVGVAHDLVGVDSLPGSPDTVVAVDEHGGTHRSTDAGVTWTQTGTGTASRPGDIHAATATHLYVTAAERHNARSTDGGVTFEAGGFGVGEALAAVTSSPVDGRRLLAVGKTAWRTSDGGTTWTSSPTGIAGALVGATLADDQRGWGVGHAGVILHTEDQGATWTTQRSATPGSPDLLAVVALDRWRAVAVGHRGTILRTVNGGASWSAVASGTVRQLVDVDANGDTLLAVGAEGTLLRSTDAGATWAAVAALPAAGADLFGIAMTPAGRAYAILRSNVVWVSTDSGATWSVATGTTGIVQRGIAARGSSVVIAGSDDAVARSTDSATSFSSTTGTTTMHLRAVTTVDSRRAIIVGADELFYELDAVAAAEAQVADWATPSNDWDAGGFFGVCLQAVGGAAVADWTVDPGGSCEQLDTDPWRAVPPTVSQAAHALSGTGTVDLVWGMRARADQRSGVYEAGITFEVLAP